MKLSDEPFKSAVPELRFVHALLLHPGGRPAKQNRYGSEASGTSSAGCVFEIDVPFPFLFLSGFVCAHVLNGSVITPALNSCTAVQALAWA